MEEVNLIQLLTYLYRLLLSRRYFPLAITVCMLGIGALSLNALRSSGKITLNKPDVVLRHQPATNSTAIATLPAQQDIYILREQAGWYKVRANGLHEGWVAKWFIEDAALISDQKLAAQILVDTPVYQEMNETGQAIGTLNIGDEVTVVSETNGWIKVMFNQQAGYIRTRIALLVNRRESPTLTDDTQLEASVDMLQVRASNQAFLAQASVDSDILYTVDLGQRFKFISEVQGEDGTDFYLSEDDRGTRGYLESRNVALEKASLNHIDKPNAKSLSQAVIVLDAGHGGEDGGAVHEEPYTEEKQVALSTTLLIKEALEAKGATVILTRADDSTVPLEDRVALSEAQQADAFISVHYDRALQDDWSGTTTYYYHEADTLLANSVNHEIAKLSKMHNNGVLFGNYLVLRENDRPSVLLELGYMSNLQDIEVLRTEDYQRSVAKAIVVGLEQYFIQSHSTQ
ncbi:N-acetylmuramoyl-L-alanine amidase [Aerococcaceae bacterium NML201209]|nr:N-acetylmuramoyl-L-alanine amidase [Aerococcaceae bacterium NML201209]